ncbi:MAG TPA: glycosyltransferase family 2 protein [Candidatus Polarisedimenticolia bacterium]|nr:glycosyltransferase family 2 protein [Candidatus Polarisedimenticolia bacterium]
MSLPVSICLTTYNRGHCLPATIDSIVGQSFGDFELIISDDCSSDHTEEVCDDYVARDRRILYFRNPRNLGMPGNLNKAISLARGEYIANLHDGDVFDPNLILKWKAALDEVSEAPFVFNAYLWLPWSGKPQICMAPFDQPEFQPDGLRVPGRTIAYHYFRTVSSCVWGTVMARRSAYEMAGPFDATFAFISDTDMWLRLSRHKTIAYIAEPLMTLRPREGGHPYAYPSWQHILWEFAIFARHWPAYCYELPQELAADYHLRLRRRMLHAMGSLIKHRKWQRVREGLSVWTVSPDPVLRAIGKMCAGSLTSPPAWLDSGLWSKAYNLIST